MKKVMICAPMNEDGLGQLKELDYRNLLAGNEVTIVHCFKTEMYTDAFLVNFYPTEEQLPAIEKSVTDVLIGLQSKIQGIEHPPKNVTVKVLFGSDPKHKIIDFISSSKADLTVIATRGKHGIEGLFSSSFAEYMIRHSPCPLFISRPH